MGAVFAARTPRIAADNEEALCPAPAVGQDTEAILERLALTGTVQRERGLNRGTRHGRTRSVFDRPDVLVVTAPALRSRPFKSTFHWHLAQSAGRRNWLRRSSFMRLLAELLPERRMRTMVFSTFAHTFNPNNLCFGCW